MAATRGDDLHKALGAAIFESHTQRRARGLHGFTAHEEAVAMNAN